MARHLACTRPVPLSTDPVYVGIDIGKQRHVAAFISTPLLESHLRFEACPTFAFEQGREGFQALLDRIGTYAPLELVWIIMEQTGHYHRPLLQYLLEHDLPVYLMHVQRRPFGPLKTDRRDALNLANHLYNQLERHIQVADTLQVARRAVPPSAAASQLQGLMRHRYELITESTRRKNKLTAICDELFPEFTRVFKNPNLPWALAVREAYPTPQALLDVPEDHIGGLIARSGGRIIPDVYVQQLRTLASGTIGTHDPVRVEALVFEQGQLIRELWMLQDHLEQLDDRIAQIVAHSRQGQILTSIPPIGPIHAATLLAVIGSIANFESAAALRSYLGWSPTLAQSGSSLDRSSLAHGGSRPAKRALYLVAWSAIRTDTEWAELYQRLVPRKCAFDERTHSYTGRGRVIGRICGQIVTLMYALLRHDYEIVAHTNPSRLPPPQLYDREIDHQHRHGHYVPHRVTERDVNRLVFQSLPSGMPGVDHEEISTGFREAAGPGARSPRAVPFDDTKRRR